MDAFDRTPDRTLADDWRFAIDPDDRGVEDGWHEPGADLSSARSVSVPHAWQEHEELGEYTGTAWYRRTVAPVEPGDDRVLLRFGAVDYEATVWVNGDRVGTNRGGYLPFEFDVTDALGASENEIAVRVRDPADLGEIPHGKQGPPWYTRVSGIWQPVELAVVPETRVDDVRVTPDMATDAAEVAIEAVGETNSGGAPPLTASVEVTQDGRALGTAEAALEDGEATVSVDLDDPAYWTPESPALCDVTVELERDGAVVDSYETHFGMRSVSVRDGDWFLNGEPLRVRGALDQAYYPDTHYRPSDPVSFREEIETAKELGFNMLRKHIKPAHPRFVALADRLGVLVWEEPANPDAYTEASKAAVREQFEGMVARDYNAPSVVAWSLYNEEWGVGIDQRDYPDRDDPERLWHDADKQAYLADLYEHARDLDPTRPVCDNSGWAHVATDVNDYHEYFVVPDREEAWRDRLAAITDDPAGNYATTEHAEGDTDPENVPLVVSEFGTWGLPALSPLEAHYGGDPHWFDHDFLEGLKRPAGVRDRFESSPLADVYDDLDALAADWQRREFASIAGAIADMRAHDDVAGYVLTEFTDIEWEFNGVLDYCRTEKAFADDLAAVNGPTMVRVEPRDYAVRAGEPVRADVVVANETNEPLETTLRIDAFGETERRDVSVDANDVLELPGAVERDAPDADGVEPATVTAELADADARWESTVTVIGEADPTGDHALYAGDGTLAASLRDLGYDVVGDLGDADAAVVTEWTDAVESLANDGGAVVVLPGTDGHLADLPIADVRELPERESWNLCASFVAQTLFDGLPRVPGRAFDGLYPYAYVTSPVDAAPVAYTEGWIANSGAIVGTLDVGAGQATVCTLRVTAGLGTDPMCGAILARLLPGDRSA